MSIVPFKAPHREVPWPLPPTDGWFHARAGYLAWIAAIVAMGSTLLYAITMIGVRPLEYTEGEILFDAARIARRLPLYTDVIAGAPEYGAPRSHHLVAYLPIYAWIVAQFPAAAAATLGRALSFAAWSATIAGIALTARRECTSLARLGAAYLFGTFVLTYWGTCVRPDELALALAAVALARTVRRRTIGVLGGALFTAAALLKPNVIGMFAGAALVELVVGRRRILAAAAGAALVAVPILAVLHVVSDGSWFHWLRLETLQPFSPGLWATRISEKLAQFVPLFAVSGWLAYRSRRAPGMAYGLAALTTSVAWTLVSLGKVGSASNYWVEPSLAALIILANAPIPPVSQRARAWLVILGLCDLTGTAAVSAWVAVHEASGARAKAAFLAEVRHQCLGVTLSDGAGIEMELNDRVIISSFQLRWMIAADQFPVAAWTDTIADPAVTCAVMQSSVLELPVEGDRGWHDGLGLEIRAAMKRRFALVDHRAGLWLYRARP